MSFNTLELPLQPEYKIADPICTYLFSILVVLTTVRILCDTGVIILEGKICAQWIVSGDLLILLLLWSVLDGSLKSQQSSGVFEVTRMSQLLALLTLHHQEVVK